MDESAKKETMMFVALPGAEPYAELPRKAVKDQLAKGQLKQSALIWSQKHNAWKQARHITQLIASKLEPRPVQARIGSQPHVRAQASPQPQVKAQAAAPAVKAGKVAPQAATATPADYALTESNSSGQFWLKIICAVLVFLIVSLIAFNWYYVDHALKANLAEDKSTFAEVPVYSHLGGFFQMDCVILHLRPSDTLTKENFIQYLSALSKATPDRPLSSRIFSNVILTSGWSAEYQINGLFWRRLSRGEMTDEERRALLLENLTKGGVPLVPKATNMDQAGRDALGEKRWNEFVATFVK